MKRLHLAIFAVLCSCGGNRKFDRWNFDTSKEQLLWAIDSSYGVVPQHKIPNKWTLYDSYSYDQKRYGFLNERRFYFFPPEEEMYSVTVLEMNGKSQIVINAVHNSSRWNLEKDLSPKEIQRIEDRFDQRIIPILKKLTKATCSREN